MQDFLYLRLVRALLAELASGLYAKDHRFLSQRKICRLWNVSWPTADSSLDWLVRQGLLTVRARSGYYVTPQSQPRALLLLHGRTPTGLPSPMTWDLKRFQFVPKPSQAARQIAAILTGLQIPSEALENLPPPGAAVDLGFESARSLFQEATRRNCGVQFYIDNGRADRRSAIVNQLLQRKPDGVIAFRRLRLYAPLQPMIAPIMAARIPVVTVFDDCEGLNVVSININNVGLGYDVARRFLKLGHRRIAVLLPRIPNPYFRDRAVGARMAMKDPCGSGAMLHVFELPGFKPIPPAVAAKFRDPAQRPTALFVTSVDLFHGLWPLLRRYKLQVPRDISIIMTAGGTQVPGCKRSFDTMKIDFPGIGKKSLSLLLALLEGHLEQRTNVLGLRYVPTGSVRAMP